LTANENIISNTAQKFLSSCLGNRYYFDNNKCGFFYSPGFEAVSKQEINDLIAVAEDCVNEMLGSKVASLFALSGLHAMSSVILAVSNPGDIIMTLNADYGGHFMTKNLLHRIGRKQIVTSHNKSGEIDILKTCEDFNKKKAKILYLDSMSMIDRIEVTKLRSKIHDNAIIIFDASHTLGLIMGGQFQNPFRDGADIVVGNTHKTFPGPHKAIIAFNDKKFGEKIMSIMSSGLYSTTHTNSLISLAITVLEIKEYGREYAKQIIDNSNFLGMLLDGMGYEIRKTVDNRYSHNHQLHIFLDKEKERGDLISYFYNNSIIINVVMPIKNRRCIRLGLQEVTRRGMKEKDMHSLAMFFNDSMKNKKIKKFVQKTNKKFSEIHYSFDVINSREH
jgi:fluorothreonine transaldolase